VIALGVQAQDTKPPVKNKKSEQKDQVVKKNDANKDKSKVEPVKKSGAPCCKEKKGCTQECKKGTTSPNTGTGTQCPGQKK